MKLNPIKKKINTKELVIEYHHDVYFLIKNVSYSVFG